MLLNSVDMTKYQVKNQQQDNNFLMDLAKIKVAVRKRPLLDLERGRHEDVIECKSGRYVFVQEQKKKVDLTS